MHCQIEYTGASSFRTTGSPSTKRALERRYLRRWPTALKDTSRCGRKLAFLHRDISIGNLMISKDGGGFLIDLDLAVREQRVGASGAKRKTGTRAFMAIGALLGEQHSFMHDLESFFWVLFWICIHCDGPGQGKVVTRYDKWNFADTWTLAMIKKGTIGDERDFIKEAQENFTLYYQPMVPWVIKLWKAVFLSERQKVERGG
ncbi:hypothetical protein V8F06_006095 [Rhypophila decipiens]